LSSQRTRGFVLGLLAGAALTAGIYFLVRSGVGPFTGDVETPAQEVQQTIENNYYRPITGDYLDRASIDGMLGDLKKRFGDKYSHYLDPKTFNDFQSATSGQFSGIGLTVDGTKQGLRVVNVIPNTPAERAGIKHGDEITRAAGKSLRGLSADAASSIIKGEPGTPVTLTVVPADGGKPRELTVNRASVRLPAVHGFMKQVNGHRIGYVRYLTFSAGAHGELAAAVKRLERKGAEGIVIDMRGNGGGLLDEAVLSASLFLHKGQLVVSTKSRTQGPKDYDAVGGMLPKVPVVMLVDRDTASAAEILTAALQDHDVATVVGTRSYGKGVFQDVITLDSGGALDLTVGSYFTPDGKSLYPKGIKPNVYVKSDPRTKQDDALKRGLAVLAGELKSSG
jgi:carboxyl-terminal processing protease